MVLAELVRQLQNGRVHDRDLLALAEATDDVLVALRAPSPTGWTPPRRPRHEIMRTSCGLRSLVRLND
jgi:hypothetical protein